jgi:hypothetical protein
MTIARPTGSVLPTDFGWTVAQQPGGEFQPWFVLFLPLFPQPDFADELTRVVRQRYIVDWYAENIVGTAANLSIANGIEKDPEDEEDTAGNIFYVQNRLETTVTAPAWGVGNAPLEQEEYPSPSKGVSRLDRIYDEQNKDYGFMRLTGRATIDNVTDDFIVYGVHVEMINDAAPLNDYFVAEFIDSASNPDSPFYKNKPLSSYILHVLWNMLQLYSAEGRAVWTFPLINEV